jgi:hypothetical protein
MENAKTANCTLILLKMALHVWQILASLIRSLWLMVFAKTALATSNLMLMGKSVFLTCARIIRLVNKDQLVNGSAKIVKNIR